MITFERRQQILRLLHQYPGVRISELAKMLHVTETTVRTDLTFLQEEGKVRRVRGGAVLVATPTLTNDLSYFSAPGDIFSQWIGSRAADLVEDGDTILLDATPLTRAMMPFLRTRRRLTIVTNDLEISRQLAQYNSFAVILIGGMVRNEGNATSGLLGAAMLYDLHIRLAFISGAGFTMEMGLVDNDLEKAHLKRIMLDAADEVVALIEAPQLGRKGLTSIAPVERFNRLFVDSRISSEQIEQLRRLPLDLTICGENTVINLSGQRTGATFKIGFANLSEELPFAVDVRRGLERAARVHRNVELVLADNRLSGERALQIADNLIAKGCQLVIEYQIDANMGAAIMNKFQRAGIPVIAVDIPMVGATFFGVDNYYSGHLAGIALGKWVQDHWQGEFDYLIVLEEPRAGSLPRARIEGQIHGFEEILGPVPNERKVILNSGNTSVVSEAETYQALLQMPEAQRIAVICFNDDAAIGALRAARRLKRERHLAIVGQGADRLVREELRHPDARIIGSTAFMPERYGEKLIDLALRILRRESTPPAVYIDHVFIDHKNINVYYPE
ncbi:substrate-binding domain-containing protein [Caldilinea sp.]|jgi:ribose transport system substrate-binding protein|uniref:substrate-binding domain-containing protein n=1 Tax=Caldilinea sp. TaxID=2293560 RepID=UPI001B1888D2|nr:substrate-binding domain-containing protein [Caldilinea sp.]MBO9392919.1 substrate-binding domain-containing protein [Caldilinea sp.]